MTRAWLRPRAEADLIERTAHYGAVGGNDLGARFFGAALAALRSVEVMPGAGSPLVSETCGVPGLRSRPVKWFPVHWYYLIAEDRLDVVRMLADAQDLPAVFETEGHL